MVRARGFEPPTTAFQVRGSTRLSYTLLRDGWDKVLPMSPEKSVTHVFGIDLILSGPHDRIRTCVIRVRSAVLIH
jgi:hypothetical protein